MEISSPVFELLWHALCAQPLRHGIAVEMGVLFFAKNSKLGNESEEIIEVVFSLEQLQNVLNNEKYAIDAKYRKRLLTKGEKFLPGVPVIFQPFSITGPAAKLIAKSLFQFFSDKVGNQKALYGVGKPPAKA